MYKFLLILMLFIVRITAFADVGKIIDACGREIYVPDEPKRIIAIGPGASALTLYADMSKFLVAKEVYGLSGIPGNFCPCAFPDDYDSLPMVYNNIPESMPDYDAIIDAKPDIIIASGFGKQQIDKIYNATRVPVAAVNCSESGYMHYDTIVQSLRLTGYVLKQEKVMQDIINYLAKLRKDLYARTKNVKPRKIFVISENYSGECKDYSIEKCYCYLKLINNQSIMPKQMGANYSVMTKAELLKIQPEYIFIEYPYLEKVKADYQKNKDFYKKLNAVKKGRVFTLLPYNHYSANVANMLIDAYYIGKTVYPENFSDVEIGTLADEISIEFSGNMYFEKIYNNTTVFKQVVFTDKGLVIKK